MAKSKVLWILRSERGLLRGPFDTQAILQMIKEGAVSGEEMIARYPGGDWIAISCEPEFYDHLLEALAQAGPEVSQPKKAKKGSAAQDEETIIARPPNEKIFHEKKAFGGRASLPPAPPGPP